MAPVPIPGTFRDEFGSQSYTNNNGTLNFAGAWTEGATTGTAEGEGATGGDIVINTGNGGRLQFNEGIDNGEYIQRLFDLTDATSASVQFSYVGDNSLTGGENVTAQAWNHSTNSWQTLTGGALSTASGNFNVALSAAQIGPLSGIRFWATGDWDDGDNFFIENFVINATKPGFNAGVDTINGDAGDDTIIWNANTVAPTDGRDLVDGGTEGAAGDTFAIIGNASSETYRIYTKAAAATAGFASAAATEIVITRQVGAAAAVVIAELAEIEEIRINSVDPAGASGPAGTGDNFEIIGDFSTTSLRLNPITIDGDAGDDTIDISALSSAHRIVFKSNGGNDTIIGTLRPEDVIELPDGATFADYASSTVNGVTTLTRGPHSISFTGPVSFLPGSDDDDEPDTDDETDDDETDGETTTPPPSEPLSPYVVYLGTSGNDTSMGNAGNDTLAGQDGDDTLFGLGGDDNLAGGAGADLLIGGAGDDIVIGNDGNDTVLAGSNNTVFAGAGDDVVYGDDGDDLIFGNEGRDVVDGGAGNDTFFATVGDNDDVYNGGAGIDTLDFSAIATAVTVNLGSTGIGSSWSVQTGTDTLSSIDNVKGGSGDDTITASHSVNVLSGGAGNDAFIFSTAAAANGDRIEGFQPGDKIDLRPIYSALNLGGDVADHLTSTPTFNAAGQIRLTIDGNDTLVEGTTDTDADVEFAIRVIGRTNLSGNDFA